MSTLPKRGHLLYNLVLPAVLLATAGLSIGLTFAPCYSTLCVETFFPYTARVHIALFYGLTASVLLALLGRAHIPALHALSSYYPSDKPIPFTTTRVSLGGVLLFAWLAGWIFGSTGYWLPAQHAFWYARGEASRWTDYSFRVVWTGVTGHWCDVLFGLVVLPVGRKSILARVAGMHAHTLLRAHFLLAWALLIGGLIHGFLYYSFLAAWIAKLESPMTPKRLVGLIFISYIPDAPTYTLAQEKQYGKYIAANLPVGAIAGIVGIPAMVITALPILRRLNYNVFYFTHVILAILVMTLLCLHASTNFYFLLPGLLLWIGDWAWRLRNGLTKKVDVRVSSAGNGWYRLVLGNGDSAAMAGLTKELDSDSEQQSTVEMLAAPLQHFYINIGQISKIQGHPFTVACPGTLNAEHTFLFRCSPERKKEKSRQKEWTWQLAKLADEAPSEKGATLSARIEGPYKPQVDPLYKADRVLAIAGGTGVTGALSIASWWIDRHLDDPAKALTLVWSVRSADLAELDELSRLQERVAGCKNIELRLHVSSEAGRLDAEAEVSSFFKDRETGRVFVYGSGPEGLLSDLEGACIRRRKQAGSNSGALDWHLTRY